MCNNPSTIDCGTKFLQVYIENYDPPKKTFFFAVFVCFFSLLLAQLSELLPPVSVVETPHVAVHVLFHSRIGASIRLASTAQVFWHNSFQIGPVAQLRSVEHVCAVA